jgi:transposase InsO family protein
MVGRQLQWFQQDHVVSRDSPDRAVIRKYSDRTGIRREFTARFRTLYVFVVLDVGTRRIVHWNVTEHPTAD